ncbi:MAG: hypothetical protein AB1442_00270 [Nitrospirota bacterium]
MKRLLVIACLLLLPAFAEAAFTIHLKNGSVISDVKSYRESGNEIIVYFGTGSITVPKSDILKIEGSESVEEEPGAEAKPEEQPAPEQGKEKETGAAGTPDEKSAQRDSLRNELDSVLSDLRAAEDREMGLVTTINEKIRSDRSYNIIQRKQFEKELEPLNQELADVQRKKTELLQQKADLEDQLKAL